MVVAELGTAATCLLAARGLLQSSAFEGCSRPSLQRSLLEMEMYGWKSRPPELFNWCAVGDDGGGKGAASSDASPMLAWVWVSGPGLNLGLMEQGTIPARLVLNWAWAQVKAT
ncbi:hypothetical protein RchiOBHm_Chr4g0439221 [Rosa chinensis]|uniref:Uncharacterized protein n=1 Tax=Rosa chinensis TaxID=74649 RepID=A0A2P6R2Y1_ROSCH|nr:hypothetical protein RchiOBHm_Chr4g0439221 [Rosa chinensis]